jgi:hypothetical protein
MPRDGREYTSSLGNALIAGVRDGIAVAVFEESTAELRLSGKAEPSLAADRGTEPQVWRRGIAPKLEGVHWPGRCS